MSSMKPNDEQRTTNDARYWMAPEDLVRLPQAGREFVSDARDERLEAGEFSRREFLKLMGISTVLAGAAACSRRPVEKIVPYLNKPEEVVPGEALWYASTSFDCHCQCGVLVKVREGRPIKLEGNPDHPVNRGGLCARSQAAVWNLYDPDRLHSPSLREKKGGEAKEIAWDDADTRIREALRQAGTKRRKVRLLTGTVGGPAQQQLIAEFLAAQPEARHIVYEPVHAGEVAHAAAECYGAPVVPRYRFDRADLVLSLGADFLGTWLSPVEFARDWAANRRLGDSHKHTSGNLLSEHSEREGGTRPALPAGGANSGFAAARSKTEGFAESMTRAPVMSRLVCCEPILTLTGTNADERYPVGATQLVTLALALAHELAAGKGSSGGEVVAALAPYAIGRRAEELGIAAAALKRLAEELWRARGRSLVVGGLLTGPLGVALQTAVNFLNHVLGNEGTTVQGTVRTSRQAQGGGAAMPSLIAEMQEGAVDLLVVAGTNPLYHLPQAMQCREAMAKVPLVVQCTERLDETSVLADLLLPVSHFLEGWGDAEPQAGVYSLIQPTIAPLYATRTFGGILCAWFPNGGIVKAEVDPNAPRPSADDKWYAYLRKVWRERVYPATGSPLPFETFWEGALRSGVVTSATADGNGSARAFSSAPLVRVANDERRTTNDALEFVAYPTVALHDGRHANNSWLQELPDPVTKITWDNYLCISPRTAKRLGLEEEDVVSVQLTQDAGRTTQDAIDLPIHIQPGLHDGVVAAPIGYGRTAAGRVGTGVGTCVADLATGLPVTLTKTRRRIPLAVTQGHHRIEGRPIIQETTLASFRNDPHAGGAEHHPLASMWEPHKYPGHRWGMAIDLGSCTGCSACVIACQVENNVPAVGKTQVLKGREMHWIRIDRYYSGDDANPQTVHQPMLCQHCEHAPCETVCPVLATVHDNEGLNVQVYNRCVGTRYCSNNCPYKVRRFNWFDYGNAHRKEYVWREPLHLLLNPDVTVREKGVMEKCTFCLQRIREAKRDAKSKDQPMADGAIRTACQQSCPTDAIVFGDSNDPESALSRLARSPRGYHVLRELNVLPQITYLTKVRNR